MTNETIKSQYIHKKMLENHPDIYPEVKLSENYNQQMQFLDKKQKEYADEFDKLHCNNNLKLTKDSEDFKINYPKTYEMFVYYSDSYTSFVEFIRDKEFNDIIYNLLKEDKSQLYLNLLMQGDTKECICEILNNEDICSGDVLQLNLKRKIYKLFRNTLEDLFYEIKQKSVNDDMLIS